MRVSSFRPVSRCFAAFWVASFLTVWAGVGRMALAEDAEPQAGTAPASQKIRITADRLISDIDGKFAEFIGNVKAVQESTTITSDSLKIYYEDNSAQKTPSLAGGDSIKKIVATGRVEIHFDQKVAKTHQAVYTTDDRVLVLTGPNSKVLSGDNVVTGSKITLERADGRITVERNAEKRVEAVIYTGEKGLR